MRAWHTNQIYTSLPTMLYNATIYSHVIKLQLHTAALYECCRSRLYGTTLITLGLYNPTGNVPRCFRNLLQHMTTHNSIYCRQSRSVVRSSATATVGNAIKQGRLRLYLNLQKMFCMLINGFVLNNISG